LKLLDLLELTLKSDEVIDVLEHYQVTVVYDFDRLHENSPDVYWASSHQAGFELRFNERQVLDTIFLYTLPRKNFGSIDPSIAGVILYSTFAEASSAFEHDGIPFHKANDGQGYIKGNFSKYQIHYEFTRDEVLSLITIMAANA
jgi:hypothetical protein